MAALARTPWRRPSWAIRHFVKSGRGRQRSRRCKWRASCACCRWWATRRWRWSGSGSCKRRFKLESGRRPVASTCFPSGGPSFSDLWWRRSRSRVRTVPTRRPSSCRWRRSARTGHPKQCPCRTSPARGWTRGRWRQRRRPVVVGGRIPRGRALGRLPRLRAVGVLVRRRACVPARRGRTVGDGSAAAAAMGQAGVRRRRRRARRVRAMSGIPGGAARPASRVSAGGRRSVGRAALKIMRRSKSTSVMAPSRVSSSRS